MKIRKINHVCIKENIILVENANFVGSHVDLKKNFEKLRLYFKASRYYNLIFSQIILT